MKKAQQEPFHVMVRVTPRSHKDEVVGYEEGVIKVRLRAVPEKGKANTSLIKVLADFFDLPISSIELSKGHTGRLKQVIIYGMTKQQALERLQSL